MTTFSENEILETLRPYLETRSRIETGELRWSALADFFVENATYIDPGWGRVDGRDNIVRFMDESMSGLDGWTFPHEWEAVNGNYLITGWQNRLPGRRADGTYYQAPGVSRMLYAGSGKFAYSHDLLNMSHVMEIIEESGWQPDERFNLPPASPERLCAWEP